MDKETAIAMLSKIEVIGSHLNELGEITNRISDDDEAKKFRKLIAKAMIAVSFDVAMPIIGQYPDLDPDKEYFKNNNSDEKNNG
jgi:hypothetical protein